MEEPLFEIVRWLLGAVARGLHMRSGEGVAEVLEKLAAQTLETSAFRAPDPTCLPVLRYFPQCTAETMLLEADLAASLAAISDHLQWRQSAAYNDANMGEGFLQNYGWSQIIGPHGFFPGRDFLLGLLMLGPRQHYKDHYHPAPELYWLLTGPTHWKRTGAFEAKPSGATIWHEPNAVHAVKTGDEPLLALWCWTESTLTPAKLTAT